MAGKGSPVAGSGGRWDVIVVGARVAGATLAAYLGTAGVRTLLVDRVRLPAYIPRQGSWDLATTRRWEALGVMPLVEATGTPTRRGYHTATADAVASYRFPVGDPVGYNRMVRRLTLDAILANFAASMPAVELRMGAAATDLLWDADRVAGVRFVEGGRSFEERARYVVGADGRHSWLARRVPVAEYERIVSPKANFIADYAGTCVEPDMSVRVWDHVGSMGMVMMEDELVTIGMGVWLHELAEFRAGLPDSFERRLRRHPLYEQQLGDGVRVSPIGGAVDLAMYKRTPFGPGWALTGDAGYHLDPLAARGTTAAVAGAELLADALVRSLAGDEPEMAALRRFHARRDELFQADWDVTYAAMMRGAPTERDIAEARLIAARPDLLRLHVDAIRGAADLDAFRAAVNAELGEPASAER